MNRPTVTQPGSSVVWHHGFACGDVVTLTGTFSGAQLRITEQHHRYCTAVLHTGRHLVPVWVPTRSYETVVGQFLVPGVVHVVGRVDLRPAGGMFWVSAVTR